MGKSNTVGRTIIFFLLMALLAILAAAGVYYGLNALLLPPGRILSTKRPLQLAASSRSAANLKMAFALF